MPIVRITITTRRVMTDPRNDAPNTAPDAVLVTAPALKSSGSLKGHVPKDLSCLVTIFHDFFGCLMMYARALCSFFISLCKYIKTQGCFYRKGVGCLRSAGRNRMSVIMPFFRVWTEKIAGYVLTSSSALSHMSKLYLSCIPPLFNQYL